MVPVKHANFLRKKFFFQEIVISYPRLLAYARVDAIFSQLKQETIFKRRNTRAAIFVSSKYFFTVFRFVVVIPIISRLYSIPVDSIRWS